jgi:hypothetical protein
MTSWPEDPTGETGCRALSGAGVSPTKRNRRAGIGLRGTIPRDRPFRLRTCRAVFEMFACGSSQASRVEAGLEQRRRTSRRALDAGQRRGRLTRDGWRVPQRGLEHVLQRTPLADMNAEVRLAVLDVEPGRWPLECRAYALDGYRHRLLCRHRENGGRNQREREGAARTPAHAVRTSRLTRRPVQGSFHGIVG